MEEASLLRETEGKLFEGNLLRLEVEELVREVRLDHGKKTVKALEVREAIGSAVCGTTEVLSFAFRAIVVQMLWTELLMSGLFFRGTSRAVLLLALARV